MSVSPDHIVYVVGLIANLFTLNPISALLQPCDYLILVPIQRSSGVQQPWSQLPLALSIFPSPPTLSINTLSFPNTRTLEQSIQHIFGPDLACYTSNSLGSVSEPFWTMSEDAEEMGMGKVDHRS